MTAPAHTFPIDGDFRRSPATRFFCALCQTGLRPGTPVEYVYLGDPCDHVVLPAALAGDEIKAPIGPECRKKIPVAYRVSESESDAGRPVTFAMPGPDLHRTATLSFTRPGSGFNIQRSWKRPEPAMAALDKAIQLVNIRPERQNDQLVPGIDGNHSGKAENQDHRDTDRPTRQRQEPK